MKTLEQLQPQQIWKHFFNICSIPHPSKHEKNIIAFVKKFGEDLGLETIVDEIGNVIIRKPATKGMENRKGVILQGHLDMVPQKNNDIKHNFETDPIKPRIDEEWLKATGTTLGADNGIGVACAMAVLESKDLAHGPIEALFTIDEETGMTGAFGLKPNILKGDILINMDSEDEGELYVGCAGGLDGTFTFKYKPTTCPGGHKSFHVQIKGLKGGHSGMDISLGRGNSNKLLFRFLKYATSEFNVAVSSIEGGSLRNAIPREAFANIVVPENKVQQFKESVKKFEGIFKNELSTTEPELKFEAIESPLPKNIMDSATQIKLINAIYACPNGVIRMSADMIGLVETSTNLAIVKSDDSEVVIKCLLRSSVDSAKEDLAEMMKAVFELAGAEIDFTGGYPGWKPNLNASILKTMQEVYKNKYGKTPEIKAVHAGLECGILGAIYPNWEMISFGPTIRYPHSPDEKVHIDSVGKFWDYLVETLKNIPTK